MLNCFAISVKVVLKNINGFLIADTDKNQSDRFTC